jgi:hypothetical protein
MNDFGKIRTARYQLRFLPHHAPARHLQARAFLEAETRKPRTGPLVVVTHHVPIPSRSFRRHDRRHGAEPSEDEVLDAAYRSDLRSLTRPGAVTHVQTGFRPPDLWVFGHSHESLDTVIGSTRVASNAKGHGYPLWDNPHFDSKLTVVI